MSRFSRVVRRVSLNCFTIATIAYFGHGGTAYGQDLIIESGVNGQNHEKYSEPLGKWIDSRIPANIAKSTAPGLSAIGSIPTRKCVFSGFNITTSSPATARFAPDFKEPGRYNVYVTWPRGANATPVRYVIKYKSDSTTKKLTQNGWGAPVSECNAGVWIDLGNYEFDSGPDQFVEVHVEPDVKLLEPNWYGQVYADAIRFTKAPLQDRGRALSPQEPPMWQGSEPPTVIADIPIKWRTDVTAAWKEAADSKKKLLLYFFSQDAFLDHYEKNLFVNQKIHDLILDKYIPVRLDMETNKDLWRKLGVYRAGTVAAYNTNGQPLGMIPRPIPADAFLSELSSF